MVFTFWNCVVLISVSRKILTVISTSYLISCNFWLQTYTCRIITINRKLIAAKCLKFIALYSPYPLRVSEFHFRVLRRD